MVLSTPLFVLFLHSWVCNHSRTQALSYSLLKGWVVETYWMQFRHIIPTLVRRLDGHPRTTFVASSSTFMRNTILVTHEHLTTYHSSWPLIPRLFYFYYYLSWLLRPSYLFFHILSFLPPRGIKLIILKRNWFDTSFALGKSEFQVWTVNNRIGDLPETAEVNVKTELVLSSWKPSSSGN